MRTCGGLADVVLEMVAFWLFIETDQIALSYLLLPLEELSTCPYVKCPLLVGFFFIPLFASAQLLPMLQD